MSSSSSLIPKAGVIEVPDAPKITAVEFIQQVVENIYAQLQSLDDELQTANDDAYVSLFSRLNKSQ